MSGENHFGIIDPMDAKTQRTTTIRLLHMSDPEAQFDEPAPGTMAERLDMVWELTAELVSLGGKMDAEQRLQRHVTHLIRGAG